jgi:hypothetical protein
MNKTMGKYKYTLKEDYHYDLGIKLQNSFVGMSEEKAYMTISPAGILTVFKDYAWDGTTMSPDFTETYYPALVHDALYQFLPKTPMSRKAIDDIFLKMMLENNFKYARIYYRAVRWFGGVFVKLTR